MESVITLRSETRPPNRPNAAGDEISYPEELVELFLDEYTRRGDLVFDPFAGFGTTLVVAERMGRRALGVELLPERVEYTRSRLRDPNAIIEGDALRIEELALPAIDFSMTSPPYMNSVDNPQNPLTGDKTLDGDYHRYLGELGSIYRVIAERLRPGGRAVINAADIITGDVTTELARDLTRELSRVLDFEESVIVESASPPPWMAADYCLIFRKPRPG